MIKFEKGFTVVKMAGYTFNFGVDVRDFTPNDFKGVGADEDPTVVIDSEGANSIIDEIERGLL